MTDLALPGSIEPAIKRPNLDKGFNPLTMILFFGVLAVVVVVLFLVRKQLLRRRAGVPALARYRPDQRHLDTEASERAGEVGRNGVLDRAGRLRDGADRGQSQLICPRLRMVADRAEHSPLRFCPGVGRDDRRDLHLRVPVPLRR